MRDRISAPEVATIAIKSTIRLYGDGLCLKCHCLIPRLSTRRGCAALVQTKFYFLRHRNQSRGYARTCDISHHVETRNVTIQGKRIIGATLRQHAHRTLAIPRRESSHVGNTTALSVCILARTHPIRCFPLCLARYPEVGCFKVTPRLF